MATISPTFSYTQIKRSVNINWIISKHLKAAMQLFLCISFPWCKELSGILRFGLFKRFKCETSSGANPLK